MSDIFKRIVIVFLALSLFTVSIIVYNFADVFSSKRDIGDVDHLTGQKIGVISAYEGDYVLSSRDDITLMRYDTLAETLMSLYYKRCDAVALTLPMAVYAENRTTGFAVNEKPIDSFNYMSISIKGDKFLDEYNEFVKEFKKTDEYQKFIERIKNNDYVEGGFVLEETGTGDVVNVAYCVDCFPGVYYDTIQNQVSGFEADILKYFCNAKNYKINWIKATEEVVYTSIYAGMADFGLANYSDIYIHEFENQDVLVLAEPYFESDIVLLEIPDYDKVSLNGIEG